MVKYVKKMVKAMRKKPIQTLLMISIFFVFILMIFKVIRYDPKVEKLDFLKNLFGMGEETNSSSSSSTVTCTGNKVLDNGGCKTLTQYCDDRNGTPNTTTFIIDDPTTWCVLNSTGSGSTANSTLSTANSTLSTATLLHWYDFSKESYDMPDYYTSEDFYITPRPYVDINVSSIEQVTKNPLYALTRYFLNGPDGEYVDVPDRGMFYRMMMIKGGFRSVHDINYTLQTQIIRTRDDDGYELDEFMPSLPPMPTTSNYTCQVEFMTADSNGIINFEVTWGAVVLRGLGEPRRSSTNPHTSDLIMIKIYQWGAPRNSGYVEFVNYMKLPGDSLGALRCSTCAGADRVAKARFSKRTSETLLGTFGTYVSPYNPYNKDPCEDDSDSSCDDEPPDYASDLPSSTAPSLHYRHIVTGVYNTNQTGEGLLTEAGTCSIYLDRTLITKINIPEQMMGHVMQFPSENLRIRNDEDSETYLRDIRMYEGVINVNDLSLRTEHLFP